MKKVTIQYYDAPKTLDAKRAAVGKIVTARALELTPVDTNNDSVTCSSETEAKLLIKDLMALANIQLQIA